MSAKKKPPRESAEEITLKIQVRRADGGPFPGKVDVRCEHQQLVSERRELRNLDASQTIAIAGLRRAPQGLYKVLVTRTDEFAQQGKFVNIPSSGFATLEFVFETTSGGRPEPEIRLVDETGGPRTDVDLGGSLLVGIGGLAPLRSYQLALSDDSGRLLFPIVLLSDQRGTIEPTDLWPQAGLNDPFAEEAPTVEEAIARWRGRRLRIELREGRRTLAQQEIPFADTFSRPLVVGTDEGGRLVNAVEAGRAEARLSAFNVPFAGSARVFMVPRQRNWAAGNRFAPVTLASGRAAFVDVAVDSGGRLQTRIARARELQPGAYDFIVRRNRYGYEDEEELFLRPDDLVTRRVTGLVVRMDFMASKLVRGGCVNKLPISGRPILGAPYFQYADTFQVGEDVYGGLDPLAVDPGMVGKMVAFYVVPSKSSVEWSSDTSLSHLAVLGGNGAVQKVPVQAGCINYNTLKLWPAASIPGDYDIVADFGNNTSDPGAFLPDDDLTSPTDIVDGYFAAGFRVVHDPTTDTQFAHAGTFEYNDGPISVTDDGGGSVMLDQKAVVYFPADGPGETTPGGISGAQPDYPILVAVHGNSSALTSYQGYNYLLEHWAKNGFIAASIHMQPNMQGTGRARVLFAHLTALKAKFGSNAANTIGIMGHSRGGEAVVIAARLNHNEALGHGIQAVISLAPTDQYTSENFGGAWAMPYLVVYGSMDGDVAGGSPAPGNTGFRLWDRASGMQKSMVFVYGATHGRFNTVWGDTDITAWWSKLGPTDIPKLITPDAHQKIAKGYMTAFFRRHLLGETQWDGIFQGDWKPAAVEAADAGNVRLYLQYRDTTRRDIDDFEGAHTPTSWQTSTIGGAVDDASSLPVDPQEDVLAILDTKTPHQTAGLLLRWDGTGDRLQFDLPAGQRDVTGFQAVSFRVTQKTGSASNPAGLPQDLYLTLRDGGGMSRAIRVSKFAEIPPPHERHNPVYTKSAMCTVRIPLPVYQIAVAGTTPVDLSDVTSAAFEFGVQAAGEVEIDNFEFTN